MHGYDRWKTTDPRDRPFPSSTEDLLGQQIWIEEEDAWGVIVGWEEWEDADEDGRHGGIDLIVIVDGRECNLGEGEVQERLARQAKEQS